MNEKMTGWTCVVCGADGANRGRPTQCHECGKDTMIPRDICHGLWQTASRETYSFSDLAALKDAVAWLGGCIVNQDFNWSGQAREYARQSFDRATLVLHHKG